MFRANLSGKSVGNYSETRFLRVRTIECEDILQKVKMDPNAGRVSFESNMQILSDMSVGKNLAVGGTAVIQGACTASAIETFSDPRLKNKINPITTDFAYTAIEALTPYAYNMAHTSKRCIGVLSTDVKRVMPDAVSTHQEFETVNYTEIGVVLLRVVQDLMERVKSMEHKIETLKNQA